MKTPSISRPNIAGSVWLGAGLIALVSTAALIAAGYGRELAISPFGWNRLIVIHSLSTLMLSAWLAKMLGQMESELTGRWMTVVWAMVGLFVAWLTVVAGSLLEPLLGSDQASYGIRFGARVLWCVILQVPWWMIALSTTKTDGTRAAPAFSSAHFLGLALVAAIGVPMSFLAVFLDQETREANQYWQTGKVGEAHLLVQRLCDVGSTASLGDRPASAESTERRVQVTPRMALSDLELTIRQIAQQIELLKVEPPTARTLIQLSQCYLALGRISEAEVGLKPLGKADPTVALMLARIYDEQGDVDASRQWAETALKLAQSADSVRAEDDVAMQAIQLDAYSLLARFAGSESDFAKAESYLLTALERLPAHEAIIHHRLSGHYKLIGELAKSQYHQQLASRLRPGQYPPPGSLLSAMLSTGAPVGLARPKSSRYQLADSPDNSPTPSAATHN